MEDRIRKICENLEKEKKIKILFAVENGSRAWGMDSLDSDFDVRFVFFRPLKEYIQINNPTDVITIAFDKGGNSCQVEGSYIDMSGFDVFKYVRMLSSSNPTTIEWLMSPIVYHGEQNKTFKEFAINNFNPIALYHHYKSMCRNNYVKYLKSGSFVTYKKYLYAYRGLINAKWVVHKKSLPPIVFLDTLNEMEEIIPGKILKKLKEIIKLKSSGEEKDIIQNIVEMDDYIEGFLKDNSEAPTEKSHSTVNDLNEELRRIIL